MASENAYIKCGVHLLMWNFKVHVTTKSVLQKSCGMIRLTVPNFLYTNEKSLVGYLKCKKHAIFPTFSKNPIILGF